MSSDLINLFNSISLTKEISKNDLKLNDVIDFFYLPDQKYYTAKIVKIVYNKYINVCIYTNNVQTDARDILLQDISNITLNTTLYKNKIEDFQTENLKRIPILYYKTGEEMIITVIKTVDVAEPYIIAYNHNKSKKEILYLSGIKITCSGSTGSVSRNFKKN
jgi:hypothetical protein